jgi:putative oxidoreductase
MLMHQRIGNWAQSHQPAWLDILRICLGLFLCFKGIAFLNDIWVLQRLLSHINLNWDSFYTAQVIAFVHLIGGFLITIGLFTRTAILFQIPVLIGAIIFNWPGMDYNTINPMVPGGVLFVWSGMDTATLNFEWWAALVTLLALVTCWVFNTGPWSMQSYLTHYEET